MIMKKSMFCFVNNFLKGGMLYTHHLSKYSFMETGVKCWGSSEFIMSC